MLPFSHLVRAARHEDAVEAAQKAKESDIIMMMTPSLICHVGKSLPRKINAKDANTENKLRESPFSDK